MEYDLTTGIHLDGKTYAGDLVRALADKQKAPTSSSADKSSTVLDTQRGVYVPRWSSGKDDTIFICHERVDVEALREALYKSDFGYTFSEKDPQPWTTVVGDRWLSEWNERDRRAELARGESNGSDDVDFTRNTTAPLSPTLSATIGGRERLNRSLVVIPAEQLVRLNGGSSDDRRIVLKKVGRTHGKTVYALAEKGRDAKDIGYVITFQKGKRPPALHVVRDINSRIFCILIGDRVTDRFDALTKENVHKTFTHYEGRMSKPLMARV